MTDALDLIAEAQRRQKIAETELAYWKGRAEKERSRLLAIIAAVKRQTIEAPRIVEDRPEWQWTEKLVESFVEVVRDPYAGMDDEDGMTPEMARNILAWRIEDAIAAALKGRHDP